MDSCCPVCYPPTMITETDTNLRAILLTVDGKGRAAKEAALEELLRRACEQAYDQAQQVMDDTMEALGP